MRLLKATILFIFAYLIPTLGFAATEVNLINGDFDASLRKVRVEIAGALLKRIDKLGQYLQIPSPSEKSWIRSEQEKIAELSGNVHDARLIKLDRMAWDFNYRGLLEFLDQAKAQEKTKNLKIEDGWVYFIHGWTRMIAEVFLHRHTHKGA